jgi:esterase
MYGGVRLHFREYGKGDPLVVLHGLCGSLDNWHSVSRRLAARFRVLAVDQRNHGQSPHHEEMSYAQMAGDLGEFLEQQSVSSAPVMGHSMGGKTAMRFAFDFPEKISRLIVVDIAPRAYEPVHVAAFQALLAVDLKSCPTRQTVESALAAAVPEPSVRQFLLKNLARDSGGGFRWKLNLRNILANYALLNAAIDPPRPSETPALFIRGGRSDFIQEPDFAAIRRCFPRAEMCTIAEAGHWVQADAPEALVARVEQFLTPAPG